MPEAPPARLQIETGAWHIKSVYQKTQGFLIFKSPAFWASIISKNIETGESLNLDAIETKKNVLVKFLLLALRMIRLFKNQ